MLGFLCYICNVGRIRLHFGVCRKYLSRHHSHALCFHGLVELEVSRRDRVSAFAVVLWSANAHWFINVLGLWYIPCIIGLLFLLYHRQSDTATYSPWVSIVTAVKHQGGCALGRPAVACCVFAWGTFTFGCGMVYTTQSEASHVEAGRSVALLPLLFISHKHTTTTVQFHCSPTASKPGARAIRITHVPDTIPRVRIGLVVAATSHDWNVVQCWPSQL